MLEEDVHVGGSGGAGGEEDERQGCQKKLQKMRGQE